MLIRIEDPETRKRLIAHLRQRWYLAVEVSEGVVAEPLNPISERHDRTALLELVRRWKQLDNKKSDFPSA
jgi:hypothetical protein